MDEQQRELLRFNNLEHKIKEEPKDRDEEIMEFMDEIMESFQLKIDPNKLHLFHPFDASFEEGFEYPTDLLNQPQLEQLVPAQPVLLPFASVQPESLQLPEPKKAEPENPVLFFKVDTSLKIRYEAKVSLDNNKKIIL